MLSYSCEITTDYYHSVPMSACMYHNHHKQKEKRKKKAKPATHNSRRRSI